MSPSQADPKFKLGWFSPGEGWREYRYPNVFEVADGEVRIGPEGGHVALVQKLLPNVGTPSHIVYVLLREVGPFAAGRYRSEGALGLDEIDDFLWLWWKFFELDARHTVRVEGPSGSLVYDQHNRVVARPVTDSLVAELSAMGMSLGAVELPIPHSHHFHDELDEVATNLLQSRRWIWSALTEED